MRSIEKGFYINPFSTLYKEHACYAGLHISFIGLGIYRILRKVGISYSSSGIFSLIVLTLYVCMVGFSVSIFRAYLMLLLRIGADMIGRVYDILTAVMLSAAILVAAEPLYLTDAAFYMSHTFQADRIGNSLGCILMKG